MVNDTPLGFGVISLCTRAIVSGAGSTRTTHQNPVAKQSTGVYAMYV